LLNKNNRKLKKKIEDHSSKTEATSYSVKVTPGTNDEDGDEKKLNTDVQAGSTESKGAGGQIVDKVIGALKTTDANEIMKMIRARRRKNSNAVAPPKEFRKMMNKNSSKHSQERIPSKDLSPMAEGTEEP